MKRTLVSLLSCAAFITHPALAESTIPYTSLSGKEALAPAFLFTSHNSIGHGIQGKPNELLPPPMPFVSDPARWRTNYLTATSNSDCNLDAMVALPDSDAVINYLKTHSYSCIQFLWQYSPAMNKLFTTSNLVAVTKELTTLSSQYSGTDIQHINELWTFIRLAYYQDYYHHLSFDKDKIKDDIVLSLKKFFSNQHVFDNTDSAGSILDTLLNTIDTAQYDAELFPELKNTLENYLNEFSKRMQSSAQRSVIFSGFYTLQRSLDTKVLVNIDSNLISSLKSYSLTKPDDQYNFVINNAIWTLGKIADNLPSFKKEANTALEAAYYTQPKFSDPWLWSTRALTMSDDCILLNSGENLCIAQVKKDLKEKLFPNTYNFEDGIISVKTALKLSEVEPLYYATKEVKSNFARVTGNLNPVADDPNTVLHVIIYASPQDYSKYHTFLFNLNSDNGGIYIEQDGTYYTYQRKSSQSIYSLQELARHEYTHYLVGRYLVPGMWGDKPFYDHNRMVFFDEGMAEFFAGSTASDNVAERFSLVNQIRTDKTRMHLPDILSATYGSFTFYRYAGMFFHFMYSKHLDAIKKYQVFTNHLDADGFDKFTKQLKNDKTLDTEYQQYLDAAVQNIANIGTPTTFAPDTSDLIYNNPSQIEVKLAATGLSSDPVCKVSTKKTSALFNCQGQINGSAMPKQDDIQAWYALSQSLNQLMKASNPSTNKTNFNWMTCWFGDIQWKKNNSDFTPSASYSCDGPLGVVV
jgi:microbial collagenase